MTFSVYFMFPFLTFSWFRSHAKPTDANSHESRRCKNAPAKSKKQQPVHLAFEKSTVSAMKCFGNGQVATRLPHPTGTHFDVVLNTKQGLDENQCVLSTYTGIDIFRMAVGEAGETGMASLFDIRNNGTYVIKKSDEPAIKHGFQVYNIWLGTKPEGAPFLRLEMDGIAKGFIWTNSKKRPVCALGKEKLRAWKCLRGTDDTTDIVCVDIGKGFDALLAVMLFSSISMV